ncbi:MerR family transcriptional regulator [Pseudonocardia sichuanensis]|uniref:MerR family transcriptional regulator n=1 Tax=Pseudonocardia kunmingensis TaxID=630975 RepID=UPI001FE8DCE7|nr:MerR family transcriptional regulator [Pseudonocardia kunmingensis]
MTTRRPPPPDVPGLSVAAVARRLGVAPGTLRTWDRRYGIGPSGHAPGRHRRYSPVDVTRLELMQRALVRGVSPGEAARYALTAPLPAGGTVAPGPAADPAPPLPAGDGQARVGGRVLRLPGAGRRARGLGRAALALDGPAVAGVLRESLAEDGVETTWDDVVRPVLAAVGERWNHTGTGVEIEHLVSECVRDLFGAGSGRAAPAASGAARPVLLAAMPGEQHTLPLLALACALDARGVAQRYLGADLPADALAAAARRTAPAAVVLWAQLGETADGDVLRALPRTRPRFRTFVAGPGWVDADVPRPIVRLASLTAALAAISDTVLV